jgi:hypothetical protein
MSVQCDIIDNKQKPPFQSESLLEQRVSPGGYQTSASKNKEHSPVIKKENIIYAKNKPIKVEP